MPIVRGSRANPWADPSDVPPQLVPAERLNPDEAVKTRKFVLEWTDGHGTINGLMYDPARIDADLVLGTIEIWEIENRSDLPHDVHLHLVQFQVLTFGGGNPNLIRRGWKDTQAVAAHATNRIIPSHRNDSSARDHLALRCFGF